MRRVRTPVPVPVPGLWSPRSYSAHHRIFGSVRQVRRHIASQAPEQFEQCLLPHRRIRNIFPSRFLRSRQTRPSRSTACAVLATCTAIALWNWALPRQFLPHSFRALPDSEAITIRRPALSAKESDWRTPTLKLMFNNYLPYTHQARQLSHACAYRLGFALERGPAFDGERCRYLLILEALACPTH